MSRRVRRRVVRRGQEKVDFPQIDENLTLDEKGVLDWTALPDDTVIQLFSCLNYRDRASLSSTCRTWRTLGKSPCLWQMLDLRPHKIDAAAASSLASRCENLQKLRFRGPESADAIIKLRAQNLREISADGCRKMTDATLSVLAARHEALECLQIGPDFCERISSDAIKAIAICCPRLQKLRISGVHEVDADAINALAKHCQNLTDIGFIDCRKVDETAMSNVKSVRFLSVAGTTNIKWNLVVELWSKLPHLIGLDVSRTDISPNTVARFFSSSFSLKVLCALNCQALEEDATFVSNNNHKGKVLLAVFTDILKGVANLFVDTPTTERNIFQHWRNSKKDKKLDDILNWLESMICSSLLGVSLSNPPGLDNFWLNQGATLLLSFMQSAQEEVQERAATALATFVVIDDENANIDTGRAEAVMRDNGIRLLLNLAQSWREGLQSEAAKAIANLSVNAKVAKAVAEEGGISILADLARSVNRLVAEEAAGGLWNLSVGEEHKVAIAEAGGVKALVDLIFKWSTSTGGEGVLERAAGALANLAADDKCSIEVASVGGVHALVMLARCCKVEGVQEQAARALANLAAHGDSNSNNAAVGQEAGALDALVQLTRSPHDGVKQEAAGALWNLSFDDRNREAIAAAGGVEALVALAHSCSNASHGLQERAAGALWGLSVSEANSIAIGREGGVAPLITLAQSDAEDVHETAAGALWNLAFNPGNALRIVDEGGVPALVHLCSSSVSKMTRFMSALALAYMFDGRMDEIALVGTSTEGSSKSINLDGPRRMALKNIEAFVLTFADPQAFSAAAASSAPAALSQVTESARIQEAGHLRCSGAEIGRFVAMLRNPSPTLKSCAAFALLQFTIPGGRHAAHHVNLLQIAGAQRLLRVAAAAAGAPLEAKIFARIVLRNLEQHQTEPHL
ncbi:protein ARABIDILLO 1 [Sesamum angolense]|uniref:Protein ARABIDILLO 1 n=1 Tax=Sesamum angolense TaxID=2727404 RepID=A0AAE2BTV1_9LAMI|nr:protein ARABIDILLO 1 [Sesamum angolense]